MPLCERCGVREACRVIGATRIEPIGAPGDCIDTGMDQQAPLAALGLLRLSEEWMRLTSEVRRGECIQYWQYSGWLELCAECYGRMVR